MSHVELARQLKIDPSYVSLIEHGRRLPRLPLLSRLALYFGCRIDDRVIAEKRGRGRGWKKFA
jgi:transcriptional regulator with XRE-family HTH domain